MSKAVILQHVAHEGPSRIATIFRDFGIQTDVRHVYRGDVVPTALDEIDSLIVLGGPMGVNDADLARFPFLNAEIELLKQAVALDRPVLGICLGAQLLAHAAGAKVYPNVKMGPPPRPGQPPKPVEPAEYLPEFGWGPVTFPFPGGTEPIVAGLIDNAPMFHWHNDTFDLPKFPPPANPAPPPAPPPPTGNALISSTRICRNQAFRFKTKLFGFQYHFELTRAGIDSMIAGDPESVSKHLPGDKLMALKADTEKYFSRYERLGDKIIKNFVQFLKAY